MSKPASPGRVEDERLTRSQARVYLEKRLGRPVGETTLVYNFGIRFYKDGRNAVYLRGDLDRFIAERLRVVQQQVFSHAG
jgi:hypothetical protein